MQLNLLTSGGSFFLVVCLLSVFREGRCCRINWMRHGDNCFRFYPLRLSRHMGRLRCLMDGGDLASISNESILQFIAQHATQYETDRFWVGLQRDSETDHLKWLDGTANVEQEHWVRAPNSHELSGYTRALQLECYAYNGALVSKVHCLERLGVICGHHIEKRRELSKCNWDLEVKHSFLGEATGNCLYVAPEQTTQNQAEEVCLRHKGHFIDVHNIMRDGLTAFYEHQVLTNDGSKYWTGLNWNGTSLFWRFGQSLTELYPIPVISGTGSCITVQFNFTDALQIHFYQTECSEQANVLCAHSLEEPETEDTTSNHTESTRDRPQMDDPSLTCPDGYNWKTDRSRSHCYWETSYETEHLSWAEAEEYCKSYGGHLASLHSDEEEKIGLSFQYGSLSHPYWIGLSLDVETETYKWSDGTPLNYTNWALGHPDHKDKRLKCVAMEAQEKHWVSSLCGILSWFICKVPKKTFHPPAIQPTPAPLKSCEKDNSASEVSYRYQDACYFGVSESQNWHRAKQYCEDEGATLVSIHSGEEIGFLLRLLHNSDMDNNRVWIGLNSFSSDDTFHWTDWSPMDFTFFSDKKQDDYQFHEKCCNMYTGNGQWNYENCNAEMGFICKRVIGDVGTTTVPTTQDPKIGNCGKGWITHNDRCYYLGGVREKDRVNWTTARNICQEEGGYLTSIRNENDQAFLSFSLQTLGVDAWIGLHDTIRSGKYYWLDNSELRYTNWAPGEPSFFGVREDCVKMVHDHSDSGVWKDDDCGSLFGYICQNRKDPQLPPPVYERGNFNCPHPEGWLQLDNMCFKMFVGNSKTWNEAEESCKKEGAHLVSVSDQRVKAAVSYLASEVNQSFFIGLKYKKDSQRISWLNDYPVQLSNWEKNEPSLLDEGTCFASSSEGYWKKAPCDEQMPYICQVTTGKRKKMRQWTGNCPTTSKEWVPGSGSFCYIIEDIFRFDWFTANLMCFSDGTHLVSIHSKHEIEDLKRLMKIGMGSAYIGLMRNKKRGFTWTDDSPVDFVNWDENEPSNSLDQCVEMMSDTMKWRITRCLSKKHYICQDQKDTLVVYEEPQNAEFIDEQRSGMSAFAISAIVLSILFVTFLLAAAVLYHYKCFDKTQFRRHVPADQSISFENALYRGGNNMEFQEENRDVL